MAALPYFIRFLLAALLPSIALKTAPHFGILVTFEGTLAAIELWRFVARNLNC